MLRTVGLGAILLALSTAPPFAADVQFGFTLTKSGIQPFAGASSDDSAGGDSTRTGSSLASNTSEASDSRAGSLSRSNGPLGSPGRSGAAPGRLK